MGVQRRTIPERRIGTDDTVGTDRDTLPDARSVRNDGRRVDRHLNHHFPQKRSGLRLYRISRPTSR